MNIIGWIIAGGEFILLLIFAFSKSYATKKGENQATKEDIGKITQIVEGIKKDLGDNTEKLKANLLLKNEYLIGITGIERDALLDYYKELHSLIKYLTRLDLTIYNIDNYKDIDIVKINIEKEFYKYDLAEAFADLFLNSQEFIVTKLEFNESVIELSKYINISFLEYRHIYNMASIDLQHKSKSELDTRAGLGSSSLEHIKKIL